MGRQFSPYISDDDLVSFIEEQVDAGRYRSYGHFFEEAARSLRDRDDDTYDY